MKIIIDYCNRMTTGAIKKPAKIASTLLVAASLTACGGPGSLLSNDKVADADNDQVVFIGDSIFALSGELQDNLEANAGETFRRYTLSGAELTGGAIATAIDQQYLEARNDNSNIDTIVMDGGGNDILIPAIFFDPHNCKTDWWQWGRLSSSCKNFIDDLYVDGVNLLNSMNADGVDNIVYLGYYYTKNAALRLDSLEEAVDYGDLKLSQACANTTANCTFVDPRSTIKDRDILIDGIHPTSSGSQKLANLIWPVLQPLL
ncbi:SGNH/GDSL hydrolase family protein [Alkalimarinus sediminis]|uniref:SGNH/GDSL hydrolase family protein n=1 Tax=Alkalimarinus sediminis TaxID=1632866 RepID=A0A9E8HGD6_9ALTE|nr:SGNH/GDSL hydrolase family protein [Alkalimarinus sediminis]UZW74173.1 SGNH/GDSL hydrolase family protein [Alkalimarinus sediminis]